MLLYKNLAREICVRKVHTNRTGRQRILSCMSSSLVGPLLLNNTVLSLSLTFLTRAAINLFKAWRDEWLTDKTGVFTSALKCRI